MHMMIMNKSLYYIFSKKKVSTLVVLCQSVVDSLRVSRGQIRKLSCNLTEVPKTWSWL